MIILKILGRIGTAIFVITEIRAERRAKKVAATSARYARRMASVLILAVLVGSCRSAGVFSFAPEALEGLPVVASVGEAWALSSCIVYSDDSLGRHTPSHIYAKGSGACGDYASLMVGLLRVASIDSELVRVRKEGKERHLVVYVPSLGYLEPQWYGRYYEPGELSIVRHYTLEQYLGGDE